MLNKYEIRLNQLLSGAPELYQGETKIIKLIIKEIKDAR
jgi:hypothetical protein